MSSDKPKLTSRGAFQSTRFSVSRAILSNVHEGATRCSFPTREIQRLRVSDRNYPPEKAHESSESFRELRESCTIDTAIATTFFNSSTSESNARCSFEIIRTLVTCRCVFVSKYKYTVLRSEKRIAFQMASRGSKYILCGLIRVICPQWKKKLSLRWRKKKKDTHTFVSVATRRACNAYYRYYIVFRNIYIYFSLSLSLSFSQRERHRRFPSVLLFPPGYVVLLFRSIVASSVVRAMLQSFKTNISYLFCLFFVCLFSVPSPTCTRYIITSIIIIN